MSKRLWIIYDGRANSGDTEDAVVLCCAGSLAEARKDCRMFGYECAIYEYDVQGQELINERYVEPFRPLLEP